MDSMEELTERLKVFRDAREWGKYHSPENLAKSIVIEAGELLENFQWGEPFNKNDVEGELADVMIYCLLLASSLDVNAFDVIRKKLALNEHRFPIEHVRGTSGKPKRTETE